MASDASIYSLIRPAAPAIDPVEQYGKGLSLANMIGQQEVQGLQTQKLRSDLQGEAEFKKLFTGGRTPTETEAIAADPTRGMAYGKAQVDRRKSEAEALKVDLENARNRLAAVQTDVDLAALREDIMRKQGPAAAADIPPSVSDPRFAQWKQTHMMSADKALDWLKPHLQPVALGGKTALVETNPNAAGFNPNVDLTHTATIGEIETGRHNKVMEPIAAGTLGVAQGRLAEEKRHNPIVEGNAANANALQTANLEGKIRDDYNAASKDYVKVRDAHQRVLASAKDPSAAGDLALIFNYMKVLDPGSTVREGEFATAQNSGGVSELVRARYNKAISGERLSDNIRTDFVDRSNRLYKAAEDNQANIEEQYRGVSTRSKVNPENVVLPQRVEGTAPPPKPKLGARQDGYIFKGGNPADPKSWEKAN